MRILVNGKKMRGMCDVISKQNFIYAIRLCDGEKRVKIILLSDV